VATVNAQPDLGSAESEGKNIIRSNGRTSLQRNPNNTLVAVGDIDTKRISGKVDVVAGQIAFGGLLGATVYRSSSR